MPWLAMRDAAVRMRAGRRLSRAAVAATVATGVALGSHVLGGGAVPSAPGGFVGDTLLA